MLSRSEYKGKLSYEDYVKRYKKHEKALPKPIDDLPPLPTDKPTDTDIPPTQEEIKKYIEDNKQKINDKTKEIIKDQIEKKTGTKFKDLEDALNDLKSQTGDTKEDKEHREHMMKGFQLARALQPNTESLSAKEIIRAKLSQASHLAYMNDDNFQKAQDYLDGMGDTNGYTIDKNLSNTEGLVIRTPEGTTEIHYRGSHIIDKPSLSDMKTNFKIITGFENEDPQFVQAKTQYENAVNEYGSVEHFGGYSKGGAKSLYMGMKYDIPSTNFNPLIGTKTARGIANTTQEHTIIRTTGDSPSLGLAVSSNANHENWNVKALRPLKKNVGLNPIKNSYDAHKLDNFTTPRNTGNVSNDPTTIENLMIKQGMLMGQKGKYETLDSIGKAVESGKTYSEFIQDLQNAGMRGDNDIGLVNGKPLIKGGRHTRGSMDGTTDYWELMGGKFTPEEENVISSNIPQPQQITNIDEAEQFLEDFNQDGSEKIPSQLTPPKDDSNVVDTDFEDVPSFKLTQEQLNKFGNSSPAERQTIMNNHNEEIINTTHELGESMMPMEATGFKEHFGEAINPVSMGAGMLVGMGVDKALDYIDPAENPDGTIRQQKITGVAREALSGGLTGAGMFAGTTALGGASLGLAPEIGIGALGYVAGSESGKLIGKGIKKLGGGEDAQEAGKDIGGGLVGGATAGLGVIGAGALTGAELGSAGGPVGIAIGASIGLLGGALGFGISEAVKHKDDIKRGFSSAGKAIGNVAKKVGGFFKKIF
jgi:hypothetical protein